MAIQKKWILSLLVVFAVGCGTLRISDTDVDRVATVAGTVAQKIVGTASIPFDNYAPGASAGIGAAVGFVVTYATRSLLRALQEKKKSDLTKLVSEVAIKPNGG